MTSWPAIRLSDRDIQNFAEPVAERVTRIFAENSGGSETRAGKTSAKFFHLRYLARRLSIRSIQAGTGGGLR